MTPLQVEKTIRHYIDGRFKKAFKESDFEKERRIKQMCFGDLKLSIQASEFHYCSPRKDCDYYHERVSGNTVFVGVGVDSEVCSWMYGYLYKTLLKLSSEHLRSKECRRLRAKKQSMLLVKLFCAGL